MERYERYKDSGVKWIGEIPSHWEVVRLKSVIKDSQSGVWGEDPKHDGSDTLCLRVADFNYNNGYLKEDNLTYRNYGKELSSNKQLQMRDLLLEKSGGGDLYPVGRVVRYNFNGIVATCSNFIQKLTPRDNVDSDFIYYLFRTMYYLKVNGLYYNQTTGIQNLKVKEYLSQTVFLPPLSEQQAIANYLDTATAKIDEAIAQQQKMIDLLNERKQIIINNAVTKGLNPDAPMKDSGVDWIGEIPEHWEINKFRNLFKTRTGITFTKAQLEEEGEPVISYGQIHSKENWGASVNPVLIRHIPASLTKGKESALAFKGDFLFADTSEDFEGCGNCVCIDTPEPIYAGYHTILAKRDNDEHKQYLAYLFASSNWRGQLRSMVNGVKVYSVTQSLLRAVIVLLPPKSEQIEIAEYITKRVVLIDAAIKRHTDRIKLLQERKQIIINEVVTGKVKVC